MQRIETPWGASTLEIEVPNDWRILGTLAPANFPPAPDVESACREALTNPIDAPRLAARDLRGRRVLVVCDDHSRPTPVSKFIAPVLEELEKTGAGISILIATGVHRASSPEEIVAKVGKEAAEKYHPLCHDGHDPDTNRFVGTTSRGTRVAMNKLVLDADLVVCMGAIEPHLLLGFGGGLKMLIPGCAGVETIGRNHLQGAEEERFDYVGVHGDESPMRSDLEEGALMGAKDVFIVNAAMDAHSRPLSFFCGHPINAHRAGERFLEEHAGIQIPTQADLVITNSAPMDTDLRQSIKCVGNFLYACKPGGVMMGLLKCDQGIGEMPTDGRSMPYTATRALLKIIGRKRILPVVERVKKDRPVEEIFVSHFALRMLRRNHLALYVDGKTVPADIGRRMGLAVSFTDTDEMTGWAASRLPKSPDVWVVPYGGATYARPNLNAPL